MHAWIGTALEPDPAANPLTLGLPLCLDHNTRTKTVSIANSAYRAELDPIATIRRILEQLDAIGVHQTTNVIAVEDVDETIVIEVANRGAELSSWMPKAN